ncbi:ABC transporter substrate-binding protein [Modestobacter roseus]|uniref:Amino acid/amide ABC transporter substrate-binding protein, HAAT family (TC 3.A.1.4.-) n=1 Tax=Modestobacter roseus TaxID=1181884 RepID=A0A562INI1_9ACTN|nr:ABC transporter substrate-binding protein [Modestobacter roseus]MQA35009.1 ABC transporter substrate-binding protein [Modestobacter roseus]TWH72440.1 amino acid/amide ABC transporter substrate-binding protein, HAAT family (TC 3.A.1.4.-) [Modestobacter roseus]
MRTRTTARAIALSGAALLALTACGGSDDSGDSGGSTDASGEKQVNVYGTDGNMGNALGEDFSDEGALAGMSGTTPLTELSGDFTDRLLAVDPELQDYNYAGETYDAVILTALAAQAAGSSEATVFAPYINGLTFGGETCDSYSACLEIINAGGNVDYDGVSGPLSFAEAGEPAQASFGILQFGEDNALDDSATEFVIAGDEANAATDEGPAYAPAGATGDPLVIGTLLPLTGNLAFLGPPEVAGAQLAINEVNEAGGVLGQPVQLIEGDSGDASTDTATQTVDRLLQQGVDAIVGAASSGVSLTVIDTITGAGVLQISPANTSDQFTEYADNGLYFRTAPPDTLQARALADLIAEDGNNTVGILAINDPYGTGLAENTRDNLVAGGLSEDSIEYITYDPQAANFDAEVQQMVDFNPDAVVVIGFEESSRIIQGLNAQGIGPQR